MWLSLAELTSSVVSSGWVSTATCWLHAPLSVASTAPTGLCWEPSTPALQVVVKGMPAAPAVGVVSNGTTAACYLPRASGAEEWGRPAVQVVMGLPAADAVESVGNGTVDAAVVDGQALNVLGTSQQAQVSDFAILDGVSLPARAVIQLAGCCLASAG